MINDYILKSADNALILGHRNSEWTGFGPIMEEDIAFASMAQDKIGHAQSLYTILKDNFNTADADTLAFKRAEKEFKCCHLVEMPNGEYDFSLMRQFLFDHAERLRYETLQQSSYEPLAKFARKIKGELKYHILHADTWLVKLGNGTEESHARMQSVLNDSFDIALGIFEPSANEQALMDEKVFIGEKALQEMWLHEISPIIERANLKLPAIKNATAGYGGRNGYHTEHLAPLLAEMCEVLNSDVNATW